MKFLARILNPLKVGLRVIYWSLAPTTKKVKTRIIKEDAAGIFATNPIFVMRRMWWAYAPDRYKVAYLIFSDSSLLRTMKGDDVESREWMTRLRDDVKALSEQMGEQGTDWDIIDFGSKDFVAIVTVDDLWMVKAKLSDINVNLIKIVFSNFVDYRPGYK